MRIPARRWRPSISSRTAAVASLLALLVTSPIAGPSYATPAAVPRSASILQRARTSDGRDTVLVVGAGTRLRLTTQDGRILRREADDPLAPQRYIVRFQDDGAAGSFADGVRRRRALAGDFERELATAMPQRFARAGAQGVRVTRVYDRLIAGAVVEAPAGWEARLRAVNGVVAVTRDLPVHADLEQSVPQVHADRVQSILGATGRGVRVGIIDTGIDYTHPALGAAFGPGARVTGGWDFVNGDGDPLDDNGHGTHVAGIVGANGPGVHGMAPGVTFTAYKVLNAGGAGWLSDVVAALERCADPDQDPSTADALEVVNLSLGASGGDEDDPASRAVDALDALGTVVAVAAGNGYRFYGIGSPGTARRAVTVGSVSKQDALSMFSSRGPTTALGLKPDLVAPGEGIVSCALGGGTVALTGTSMATPHVAGAAALLLEVHPDWRPDELRSALIGAAADVHRAPFEQGAGRLDAWAAANATLFTSPTRLAFGRVRPGGPLPVAVETLHVHSTAAGVAHVTFALRAAMTPPGGASVTFEPVALDLAPGAEGMTVVTVRLMASRPPNLTPPFAFAGVIEVACADEVRRVPFALHDCLAFDAVAGGFPTWGVLTDERTAWSDAGGFGSRWYVPPGTYDFLGFTFGDAEEPFRARSGITATTDTVVEMSDGIPAAAMAWGLRDEHGGSLHPARYDLMLLHRSGAGVGLIGARLPAQLRIPQGSNRLRLEWAAYDDTGDVRYDIPGTVPGPFAPSTLGNASADLHRTIEHVRVTPPDSVLALEFRLHPSGDDGYYGFAGLDPFATPLGRSYDVVRWTAPTPAPRHTRFGRETDLVNAAVARGGSGDYYHSAGAAWQLDHGDTVLVYPGPGQREPWFASTGRELPFGTGHALWNSRVQLSFNQMFVQPRDWFRPPFSDVVRSAVSGHPMTFELRQGGSVVETGTVPEARPAFGFAGWGHTLPGDGAYEVELRSSGWTVAGAPSEASVRIRLDTRGPEQTLEAPRQFAVFADGGPVERIAFGFARDPHVELLLEDAVVPQLVRLDCRRSGEAAWTPLPVTRSGSRARAALPALDGPFELRLGLGGTAAGPAPLEIQLSPAGVGVATAASSVAVVQADADATGARLAWRVGIGGLTVNIERQEPGGAWRPYADVDSDPDGIARYVDAAIVAGRSYGYRLAGTGAAVWLRVPPPGAALALTVAPDPSPHDLFASVTLDRVSPFTLTLYDVQGRVVSRRRLDSLAPGEHVLAMTAGSRPSAGLYFVRLVRGSETITRRVTLLP